jgi:hypothetical protein
MRESAARRKVGYPACLIVAEQKLGSYGEQPKSYEFADGRNEAVNSASFAKGGPIKVRELSSYAGRRVVNAADGRSAL